MGYKRAMPHQHNYDIEKYRIEYLPLWGYGGFYAIANASDQADIAIEDAVVSAGAGNASVGEITDSGVCGLKIDAAGDLVVIMWPIPYDCDVKSDVDFAVQWSSDQATLTDTFTWKVLYKEITVDTTAIDIPATALDTTITADTNVAGVHALQQTPYGTINGGTLTNGRVLLVHVELDAVSGATLGSDIVAAYNLVIRYVRRAL
jgi:hypothetical protein